MDSAVIKKKLESLFRCMQRIKINCPVNVEILNIVVHEYDSINMHIVFAVCTKHMTDFEKFAKHIITLTT